MGGGGATCIASIQLFQAGQRWREGRLHVRSMRFVVAGAAVAFLVMGRSASAAPITNVSSSLITDSGAIADDPSLTGRVQNLLNVTTSNGGAADWTNSFIRISLTTGSVYNATNAVGTESTPSSGSALWGNAGFRNGRFDSFVNTKGSGTVPGNADVIGGVDAAGNATPGGTQIGLKNTDVNAKLVSVQWGLPSSMIDTGTFSIARFTLSGDAAGTFFGQSFDTTSEGVGTPFSGTIANGVMMVPEPASLGLLSAAAAVGLIRRRRRDGRA